MPETWANFQVADNPSAIMSAPQSPEGNLRQMVGSEDVFPGCCCDPFSWAWHRATDALSTRRKYGRPYVTSRRTAGLPVEYVYAPPFTRDMTA